MLNSTLLYTFPTLKTKHIYLSILDEWLNYKVLFFYYSLALLAWILMVVYDLRFLV